MSDAERASAARLLRALRPFADMTPADRHAVQRSSGMFSPNEDVRSQNDAYEVRPDVCVEDACLTTALLLRMVVAQLQCSAATPTCIGRTRRWWRASPALAGSHVAR